ncbi:hypothetical protein D3C87_2048690 [compost metagenome]
MGSNLELEIPSVLVAPIVVDGKPQAILYLTKCDLACPFDEADLRKVTGFCQVVSLGLDRRKARSQR